MTENVLLAGVVGSTAYGLAHEGSDVDRLGVYAVPTEMLHGLVDPPWSVVSTNPDLTMHEAVKWCRLALSCNPTAMELVWLNEYEVIRPLGAELITIRKAFLSAKAVRNAYLGYATQQLTKLKLREPDDESRLKSEKNARHLYRLVIQGTHLHQTGELMIKLPDPELVRWTGEQISAEPRIGDGVIRQAEEVFNEPSALPAEPDKEAVQEWLLSVRRAFYEKSDE